MRTVKSPCGAHYPSHQRGSPLYYSTSVYPFNTENKAESNSCQHHNSKQTKKTLLSNHTELGTPLSAAILRQQFQPQNAPRRAETSSISPPRHRTLKEQENFAVKVQLLPDPVPWPWWLLSHKCIPPSCSLFFKRCRYAPTHRCFIHIYLGSYP